MNVCEIYRDRWIVVVDKPSGLPTQAPRGKGDNLYDRLLQSERYVGLHHRLDQQASGLLLFTLDRRANRGIAQGLQNQTVSRQYLAVFYGEISSEVPVVWEREVDGKSAKTTVHPLGTNQGLTAARVRLHTGRKHQIRVHASLASRPVVGDRRYGGDAGRRWNRLALHATQLTLTHPVTGDPLDLRSPIPADLEELWAQAGGITTPPM